jgi:hypothetical protein
MKMSLPKTVLALSVLCCIISPARSQSLSLSAKSNGKTATITLSPGSTPVAFRVVTGAPYSGREHAEHVPARAESSDTVTYRDSLGRTRTERMIFPEPPFTLVQVFDPVAGCFYVLDSVEQVAYRLPAGAITTPPRKPDPPEMTRTLPGGGTITTERLGVKTMFGVTVDGAGFTIVHEGRATARGETWRSHRLGIVVYGTNRSADGSVTTQTMLDLSTADPDPTLFQVPAGYRIVEEPGAFTINLSFSR